MTPAPMYIYRDGAWKLATRAERETAKKWAGMDALIALNGHTFVRNSKGTYDRWRGANHKPGDEPK